MTKRMRELQALILQKSSEAKGYTEGETKDITKATALLDEVDELQKEFDALERVEKAGQAGVPTTPVPNTEKKATGFAAIAKMLQRKPMDEAEKALISGEDAASGENYLVPEDVKAEVNELRKTYVSAKNVVTVETTDSLSGSVNYEAGAVPGLTAFEDGGDIAEAQPSFVQKKFAIGWYGKLVPVSRILLGAEKAGLLGYINRWFVKNAVVSENAAIFAALKAGYNGGAPKAVAGWAALKKSINVDLDPACKINGMIVTNQSGFAALDEEVDGDGRPVLQPNPAHPTEKLFQGLPVHVFPDAQLANIDGTHFPMIYGDTKAGATFVEHQNLEFTASEHFLFGKNQNCLRVVEGFDVMSTDTSAYIYGSFAATPKA